MKAKKKLKKFYRLVVVEDEQQDFIYLKDMVNRKDLNFLESKNIKKSTLKNFIKECQLKVESEQPFGKEDAFDDVIKFLESGQIISKEKLTYSESSKKEEMIFNSNMLKNEK